jgi:hypothetical protein
MIRADLERSFGELCVAARYGHGEVLGEKLIELLAVHNLSDGFLDYSRLQRRAQGYSRNLISEKCGASIWAMIWSPGAATPIHDHHCSCGFAVLRGNLREMRFYVNARGQISTSQSLIRASGFVASMVPSGPNIHQMINESAEEAISLHVYGYSPASHGSSIAREYSLSRAAMTL